MYIFLDESGDLGFDFDKKGTSNFFVITLLVVYSEKDKRKLEKSVERTIKRKIKKGRKNKRGKENIELKGTKTTLEVKTYFWNQISSISFEIYTLILNKQKALDYLKSDKDRLYNYISRLILEKVTFSKERIRIILIIDKSKKSKERQEFNNYILMQLKGLVSPQILLEIFHNDSSESKGIQAVDMFSWGIFRKYEWEDFLWYEIFKEKIALENVYLS